MKKRILCFILTAVFLLCALCGCEQNAPTKGGTALCEWFDEAGFLEGMSQQEYLLWLDGLSVSGKGLMIGIKTEKPAKEIVNKCIENGVLCLTAKDKVRLLPALNIPFEVLKKAIAIIKSACAE